MANSCRRRKGLQELARAVRHKEGAKAPSLWLVAQGPGDAAPGRRPTRDGAHGAHRAAGQNSSNVDDELQSCRCHDPIS